MELHDTAPAGMVPDGVVRSMLARFHPDRAEWLRRLLRRHGHDVLVADTDERAMRCVDRDLVLVEIDDGDESLQLCRDLRDQRDIALVAVSGRDTEPERLRVLAAGCDDHLFWECGPAETMARVDAVLRWVQPWSAEVALVVHGPLRIDAGTREVRLSGEPIHLTRKEFDLLRLLAGRAGAVVDRAEILETVWGEDSAVVGRSLDTHVSSLRRKVGRWVCVTVKGYGLRIGSPDEVGP
ncbi:response regulator transcription factor [Actinokineospora diospyrosa]|uniref:DNA-binding response regulator, OmpR family, contains REC and winged-helix (WHTH) domain n=1 Tax=Actinokineospora diospyrosa TaxID=103728 RepID=A0ABT1IEQ7_9PSEU|nr:response regulator transcription factor [Actinokineospora diospyrosa]MCP2270811.1 DNA-binding response regulator, OmpR family, contains REC and winged-helix (wHTH) domain [Actinokineospora diospyrosa]